MKILRPNFPHVALVFLAFGLMTIYLLTMAPGLTWANGGSDGGDLITAAATGGVAHPTGYPVYLLVARLFQLLPFGSLAFRTNILSALATVMAALLVHAIVENSLRISHPKADTLAGFIAGTAFGLSPLAWSQAVITEVYPLHIFFISLLLYLLTIPKSESQIKYLAIGLVQGLAMGNHILAGLMIPAVLLIASFRKIPENGLKGSVGKNWRWDRQSFANVCIGVVIGILSYVSLPLRAAAHPPVNWGDPVTWDRFFWLVSGQLYQDRFFLLDLASVWNHLQTWANLTLQQFGLFGLLISLVGLVVFFNPSRLYFLTLWTALIFTLFSIQYNVIDSFVYLLPVFLVFSIWIGLGIGQIIHFISHYQQQSGWIILLICLAYLSLLAASHWSQVDASHDLRAEAFGSQVLSEAPSGAILFAEGDRTVFTLWYFHYGLRLRPDVIVLANSLLPFDWYRENLRYIYPNLILPDSTPDTWLSTIRRVNPNRPACYPSYLEPTLICE
jgi:lipoprotein signal peptidase